MLFTRLARTIIKHNRAVFVIWLVALALSVPAVLQVQSVIVYTETAYNPKNSESSIAQSIVSKEFSISQGSSIVVVITSTDVRGNDVRDFTLTLNKTLHNDRTITMQRATTEGEVSHAVDQAALYAKQTMSSRSLCAWKNIPRFLVAVDRAAADWNRKRESLTDDTLRFRSASSPLEFVLANETFFIENGCGSPWGFFAPYLR